MLKVVSINLDWTSHYTPRKLAAFEAWVESVNPHLLLCQEATVHIKGDEYESPLAEIGQYSLLRNSDGSVFENTRVASYAKACLAKPYLEQSDVRLQKINVGTLDLYNAYLPHEHTARKVFVKNWEKFVGVAARTGKPIAIMGDFNSVLFEEHCIKRDSKYVSATKDIFATIMKVGQLSDLPTFDERSVFKFTVEARGKEFRADFALVSTTIAGDSKVKYEHEVRECKREQELLRNSGQKWVRKVTPFTDHSAIVAEFPIS